MGRPERTEQQGAAVQSRERDVFLRAGAGTGKTSVLVDRFCEAALDPEMGVERILAFTFTERAADQLRRRVRETLAEMAEEAEGERLERILEAAEASERAWISTIHGFCRRLLASHPAAAGLDPRFRVADEPEADRLATRAFDAALEELVAEGGAEALALAAANHKRTLIEMTSGAYDELRSRGQTEPALPEPPEVDHPTALAELIAAARAAHDECAEASGRTAAHRELIAAATELDPAAPADGELLDRLAGMKLNTSAKAFAGPECEAYREALQRARAAAAATVLAPAYAQLRELVSGFGRAYERLKADRSCLDFEDLQLHARELLRSNDRIRDRYREQFRHLMVDEFQDTNGLQLGLIEQLRGPDTRVFMVGDEFQSIYGFRHADIDVYRRQQRRFAGDEEPNGESLPLTGNFRAAPELLAATNALGAALLDGFEPLTAPGDNGARKGDPAVEMLLTVDDRKGWEDPDTKLLRLPDDPSAAPKVAEARRLAGRLRELVDAGQDPSEIVVLMRAYTHVNTLERSLAQAGLDPYVVGGRGFWSQQQIEDLRCMLAVVANPLDDEPVFGALASPACAVLPDTLWLLRRAATEEREDGSERHLHIWPLLRDLAEAGEPSRGDREAAALIPPEELERLRGFVETLSALRRRGAEDGLEALVERVASAFDYDLATLVRDSGEARWANVRKLMRLAREFEAREGPDLTAFLDYLANRAARSDREAEAATRAEGHAGVRVMTIHSAKGLEFDVVAVADMGRNLQIGWTPLRLAPAEDEPDSGEVSRVGIQLGRLGRPGERMFDYYELADLAADREAEEEGRLAYVAATRAKKRLLLSGTFNPKALEAEPIRRKPIANQLIRTLLDGEPDERDLELPAAADGYPAGRLRVKVSAPEPGAGARLLVEQPAPEAAPVAMDDAPPLGRPQVAPAPAGALSYSALSDYEACGYRFYAERVLGIAGGDAAIAPDPAAGEEAHVDPEARRRYGPGLAVHALLEWSSEHRWAEPDAERIATALREQGLPDGAEQVDHARELVRGWLGSELRGELGDARTSPEVPFVLSIVGTPIRGSIDLLADRGNQGTLVVDYKTDRLDGREPERLAGRYRVQRDLYALAAAERGVPVETAYVFLERPDSPVRQTFGQAELDAARERIEGLLGRLGAGEFGVTHHPHRAICHDCPARERLCSHEPAAHMRDDPDPPIVPVPRSERPKPEPDAEDGTGPAPDPEGGEPQMSLLD
jgi:ATP-dependent exoDNAse (exonuclease V) beta subunit